MPNDDENVHGMMGSNELIAELLAKRKGKEIVEQVHIQLSNADFKRELLGLRRKFGITVKSTLGDDFVDQHIVNSVYKKQHGIDVEQQGGVTDIQAFIDTYSPFKKELSAIMAKYCVPPHLERAFKVYLVKDSLSSLEAVHNLITISMDKKSKDLVIRISAASRSSSDLKAATPLIYERWDMLRSKPTKYQPKKKVMRDAEIARYYQKHGERKTLDKYMKDGFEADAIARAISRIKRKAKS